MIASFIRRFRWYAVLVLIDSSRRLIVLSDWVMPDPMAPRPIVPGRRSRILSVPNFPDRSAT
jgi:hypothetical protein